jgi:hypothetical protein
MEPIFHSAARIDAVSGKKSGNIPLSKSFCFAARSARSRSRSGPKARCNCATKASACGVSTRLYWLSILTVKRTPCGGLAILIFLRNRRRVFQE